MTELQRRTPSPSGNRSGATSRKPARASPGPAPRSSPGSAAVARDDTSEVAVATRTALEGMTGAGRPARRHRPTGRRRRRRPAADPGRARGRRARPGRRDASALTGRPVDPAVEARRTAGRDRAPRRRGPRRRRPADPVEALRLATEAHRLADEALLAARDAAAAADRVVAAADSTVRTAAAEVDRAAAFIAARRRGVGEAARTRLAEAQRHLAAASGLLATDPAPALEEGRRAQALAQEAYRLGPGRLLRLGPGRTRLGPARRHPGRRPDDADPRPDPRRRHRRRHLRRRPVGRRLGRLAVGWLRAVGRCRSGRRRLGWRRRLRVRRLRRRWWRRRRTFARRAMVSPVATTRLCTGALSGRTVSI